MKKTVAGLALAAAGTLALAGCQTTSTIDQTVQTSLPKICAASEVAHTAFLTYVEVGKVSAKDRRIELAAYQSLASICADPANQNTVTILVAAANAYATVAAALKNAED